MAHHTQCSDFDFSNVSDRNKPAAMKYSDFVAAVNAGQIKQVTIDGLNISGEKPMVLL